MIEGRAHRFAVRVERARERWRHAVLVVLLGAVGGRVPHHPVFAVHEVAAVGLFDQEGRHAVRGQPLLIVQVVADDDVHHAKRERGVGLRLEGNPLVGDGRCRAQAGVHHHDLRALLARLHEVAEFGRVRVGHVAAPQHDHVRVEVVARVVRAALHAVGQDHTHAGALIAHDALDVEHGAAERAGEARGRAHGEVARVAGERVEAGGLLAVLVLRLKQLLRDFVHGLIPRDALEFA